MRLALPLTPAQRDAIDGHVRLLLAWTTAINLTAIREPGAVAVAHVLDSLTGVAVLREHGVDAFMDLGSGGGFPGLPLAIALPARRAVLAEATKKKARFLETAIEATKGDAAGPEIAVAAIRAEALAHDPAHRGRWPCVTARAVASLADLIELGLPLLRPDGILVAWKRGDLDAELRSGRRALDTLGGGRIETRPVDLPGLEGHRLIVVRSAGQVPAAYPRDPAARLRRPW